MRIYFLIIIYIVLIFQNYLYSNSLLEENDYNQIIETIEEQKEIEEIQNSNIPEKPNIFDKINNRESVRNMILNISLYLENGGDINVADNEGNTLLMKSVYLGYYDLADYILLNNADISLTNNNGENALILSADYPYIINLILNNNIDNLDSADNKGKTALFHACEFGNLNSVRILIKSGSDINKRDIFGKTILMYAVESENLELIKYLIEDIEVDINEKDDWGQNAIFFATKINIARYLIYKDIDYLEPNSIGLKAYEVLRYNGYNNLSTYLKKLEKK
ncbi:ankyrin repeat domain-containing protein [uncultured Brachyspira sp.]|uniref:ankyrin repeat domain-containing protein n=1 Tax=uncultured Brachyspira sp. TaxID=221953 RepID=UPI002593B563|nr:ankyrin repeat domain-containing protein [uncultured Brachyspira sp.]